MDLDIPQFRKRKPAIEAVELETEHPHSVDPAEQMKLLRGLRDEELNRNLADWDGIREFQKAGHSVSDDSRRLDALLAQINGRLQALGKKPVAQEELP